MKTINHLSELFLIFFFIFSLQYVSAQTGNWKLAGNNLTGAQKLGSLNNFDVNIYTNNLTRMTLKASGLIGIGTTSPIRKLQVQDGDIRISRGTSNARYLEFISTVANQNDARMEYSSAGSYLYFSSSTNDFTSFKDMARFETSATPTYVLTVYGSALASGGTWTNSDLLLKKDINDLTSAMDIVKQLKPKTYFLKKDEYKSLNLSSAKQYGFVAQELEKVLPELIQVSKQPVRVNAQGEREMEDIKSINYAELIPLLTKAIQEQDQKLNSQQQKIEELTKLVEKLTAVLKSSVQNE